MSCGRGSSSCGFFCAARNRRLEGVARAASSARIEDSRPTTNGAIMCGKTTMSRNGTSGRDSICRVKFSEGFMGFSMSGPALGEDQRVTAARTGPGRTRSSRLAEDRNRVGVVFDHVRGDDTFLGVVFGRNLGHDV